MNAHASYFRLGLFIMAAVGAGVIILVVLGVGSLFRPKVLLETYFDGSVQGLDVGAPVKLRGVTIGEVSYIGFTRGRYEQDVLPMDQRQYVLVEAVIRPDRLSPSGRIPTPEMVESMVDRGLRVRMTAFGVTGINFLELDFMDPAEHPPIPIDWKPENLYVPSAPGAVTQFIQYADNIARRLDRLDVESIVDNTNRLLVNLDSKVSAVDAARINTQLIQMLDGLSASLEQLNRVISSPAFDDIPTDLGVAAANLRALSESPRFEETMNALQQTLKRLDGAVVDMESMVSGYEHDVALSLDNLRALTDSLRALGEEAGHHPGLIWTRPPEPVEIPRP
ncbi:MlaD family protein [Thioalkalivibrio sulfidiphilus]|uniref:MlaD family protein n=1 Tax=Thioalkalivibrio sulfidiphilus TaxID=1033854 RepID=UPI00036CF4EF|nr:MlaD family protein [Thioalkalivibrio sulfidiphilus]